MADLGFGVLGPLEVWRGARRLAVPDGRRRSVLAALLVQAGNPVPVDALVEAAWGDGLPANPRAALHTVVSRLRSQLGYDALNAGPAGYQIDVPADALDSNGSAGRRARSGPSRRPSCSTRVWACGGDLPTPSSPTGNSSGWRPAGSSCCAPTPGRSGPGWRSTSATRRTPCGA